MLPFAAVTLAAQLTINDVVSAHPVSGSSPFAFSWSPDGSRYLYAMPGKRAKGAPVLHVRDVATGRDRVLFAANAQSRGSRSRAVSQIVWSPDGRRIAFLDRGALHVSDADGTHDVTVARDTDDPQWSPDGTRIAYVHANDVYVAGVPGARAGSSDTHVSRVTTGGSATRINGDPDWLYSEEMDVEHAYSWSPDGTAIAYLSFDESPVTAFPIQNYLPTVNNVEWQRYPLAGGKNPRVSLHVVDMRTERTIVLYDGAPRDEYVLSFVWTPDGRDVVDEIVDRSQRSLRLTAFSRDGGAARTLLRETDQHFVDVQPPPVWLDGGRSFLWLSERDGVQALYRVQTRTGAAVRLTGSYPVASIESVREREGVVYVSAFYPTRRDRALLRVPLHGGAAKDLTPGEGAHDVTIPQHGDAYIETASSFNSPPVITLRSLRGGKVVTLYRTPDLSKWNLGTTRRLEIPSRWGPLDAQLTVPRDFDPHQRYPVIVEAYGGPLPVSWGVPSNDQWQGLFPLLLAQHGFLVFTIDGPASNNDRAANERLFSSSMGEIAMAGQLAGAAWLAKQPYVDASRLGLEGWSYGGYLTAFALTHAPAVFRSGIAGAPPADWRFYDSAYTERYMGIPQHNAAAYQRTSVLPAAGRLRAKLLIVQGSADDNVHLMNSIALLRAFDDAGRQVDYYVYPGARHGVSGIAAERNLDTRMLDWWEQTLGSNSVATSDR